MIQLYTYNEGSINEILSRKKQETADVAETVREILEKVKSEGDAALYQLTETFDGAKLDSLYVTESEWMEGINQVESSFLVALEMARGKIETFHKNQIRNSFLLYEQDGVVLGQKIMPMERVGIYVPGGTACYPSSVLMNAIPAKLAGVREVIMITPPRKDGTLSPAILAAAKLAGVDAIIKCGGAQGIGALAYGTECIPKVDKIVGPGNIYVAAAKQQVFGEVAIDMIAGPSEILIIADESCNPQFVAADMLSQAEHDPLASAVLLTTSVKLAEAVAEELEVQIPLLSRKEIARSSIDCRGKIVITHTLQQAVDVANAIAPEHLELSVTEPFALLGKVKNAGSIFLGHFAPEALGDYMAGPNHVLPTNGTARFSSPLSVDDFIRKSSFVYYTKEALCKVKEQIVILAEQEGLDAHGKSVSIRFADKMNKNGSKK